MMSRRDIRRKREQTEWKRGEAKRRTARREETKKEMSAESSSFLLSVTGSALLEVLTLSLHLSTPSTVIDASTGPNHRGLPSNTHSYKHMKQTHMHAHTLPTWTCRSRITDTHMRTHTHKHTVTPSLALCKPHGRTQ